MGRPKGSTLHTDNKIILALLLKPRSFGEFERCLVKEFPFKAPGFAKEKNPEAYARLKGLHERFYRIPKKTLARRLKSLVAKGWITKKVLSKHGHHVEYELSFSKHKEILEALPVLKLILTRTQKRLLRTIDRVGPLKEEIPELIGMSYDEVLGIFIRLRAGEYVCPRCLTQGKGKRALNVSIDADARFYCRSCGEEVTIEETQKLLSETLEKNVAKRFAEGLPELQRFFQAIDKQLKSASHRREKISHYET